jgi:hypothetical protein
MKNKFTDLHNHLFMELERLGDEDLDGEKLVSEISRADAVCKAAGQIVSNGRLVLDAARAAADFPELKKLPLLLE